MRLKNRGFINFHTNRTKLSRYLLVLITIGLMAPVLVACNSEPEVQVQQDVEVEAPLMTADNQPIKEGAETQEVNSAIQCDGEVGEDGKVKAGTQTTPETTDDCDKISGVPYFQPDPTNPGSGAIYYRENDGADVIVVHDHYSPGPSFWYFGGGTRTVIMPTSMMYSSGRPVIQGSRPVLSTVPNTATVARTPISVNSGKIGVQPLKSTATFKAPLTSTPITGGKVDAAAIGSAKTRVSVPPSAVKGSSTTPSSVRSVPSSSSGKSSVGSSSSSVGRGVSAGGSRGGGGSSG